MLYIHVRTCIYYEWKIMYCITKLTFASYTLQLNGSHWLCFSRIFSYSVTCNVQNKIIRIFQAGCFRKTELGGVYMFLFLFFEIPARNITSANVWEHMSSHMKVSGVCSPFVMQPCDALSRASCRWYIPVIEPWYYSCTLWVRAKRKSYCNLYVSEHQYVTWQIAYNWNIHIFWSETEYHWRTTHLFNSNTVLEF